MKTLEELKDLIGYRQTNAALTDHLYKLQARDIITILAGDITDDEISERLFKTVVVDVYGVDLAEQPGEESR